MQNVLRNNPFIHSLGREGRQRAIAYSDAIDNAIQARIAAIKFAVSTFRALLIPTATKATVTIGEFRTAVENANTQFQADLTTAKTALDDFKQYTIPAK
jgi:hypothetical protein